MIITTYMFLQNEPENMCRTACLLFLFPSDLLWPGIDLKLLNGLRTHAVSSLDITARWDGFELFAARSTDPRAYNVEMAFFFTFDLTLT